MFSHQCWIMLVSASTRCVSVFLFFLRLCISAMSKVFRLCFGKLPHVDWLGMLALTQVYRYKRRSDTLRQFRCYLLLQVHWRQNRPRWILSVTGCIQNAGYWFAGIDNRKMASEVLQFWAYTRRLTGLVQCKKTAQCFESHFLNLSHNALEVTFLAWTCCFYVFMCPGLQFDMFAAALSEEVLCAVFCTDRLKQCLV